MPISSMHISSGKNLNTTSPDALTKNKTNEINSCLKKVSLIENTFIALENNNYIYSPLIAIKNFFITTKYKLLGQVLSQPPADIELNNILSQGSELSYDSDVIHSLLNDKPGMVPSLPSLTTKKGLALGGLLVTGTIVGSGLYYFQRTGREHPHDTPYNMTHSDLSSTAPPPDNTTYSQPPSASLLPYSSHNPFHTPFHTHASTDLRHNSSEILDDAFYRLKKISSDNKGKSAQLSFYSLKYHKGIILKKAKEKEKNNTPDCRTVYSQKKLSAPPTITYSYSTKQPAVCLTKSFNLRCQIAHQQASEKYDCILIQEKLTLKIKGQYCYCPPADWIDIEIVEPPQLARKKKKRKKKPSTIIPVTTTQLTPLIPVSANNPHIVPSYDNDEITKNRLTHSNSYIIPPRKSLDTLPNTTSLIPSTGENSPDVTRVSLVACRDEREHLTESTIYRLVGETLINPIATTLREGQIIIQYSYLSIGCRNNTEFNDTTKKVESAIDSLLSWVPGYDKFRFVCRVVAFILEAYSDALEDKEVNMESIEDLNSRLVGLSKDIISSISTKDIDRLSKKNDHQETKDMMKSFVYKDNELILNLEYNKKIKLQKKFNHFSDPDSNGFIFYDYEKKWVIDNDVKLNNHIKESFEYSMKRWEDIENVYFFKNSSPNMYGNGVILKYNKDLYSLINHESKNSELYKIVEIKLSDTVFRYLIAEDDELIPIIYEGESWCFEKSTNHYVSEEIVNFLMHNNKIKDKLVSKNIRHQDVSPLTPGREFQFDKDFNEYIKINDQYFMIKISQDTSYYIEGPNDLLMLQRGGDGFYIKESLLDGICCFHKEPLNKIKGMPSDEQFFLDNTVIKDINVFNSNSESKTIIKNIVDNHMKVSPNIKGAIIDEGVNYLYYKDSLIQINSNNDDTYTLFDPNDSGNNILIYRNSRSDTYFKLPRNKKKWHGLIKKSRRCIVKRQPMATCTLDYFETDRIRALLEKNSAQGIIINDHQNQLEPYEGFYAIYKKKNDDGSLYYKGKDDLFFHVKKTEEIKSSLTPSFFTIYGKNANQQIDLNYVISGVTIIKDFDTKKIIFSTPKEAQENLFDIEKRFSSLVLKWQEEDVVRREITPIDLLDIKNQIPLITDLSSLYELFNPSGKKAITSIKHVDIILKKEIDKLLAPGSVNHLEIDNLQHIETSELHPVIADICSNAFKKNIKNINEAISKIENSKGKIDYYVQHVLGISEPNARGIFIRSLKRKLEMMNMIFDENDKKNIIIIFKKNSEEKNKMLLSKQGTSVLGFVILHDPLDRVFINMAMMDDFSSEVIGQGSRVDFDNPEFIQPDTPKRNRLYFINLIADTMLHEAVHALGCTEDYLYLHKDSEGHLDNIDNSIQQIENAIRHDKMKKSKFEYLSKLYFMNNPLYNGLTLNSINRPEALTEIFREDSFFRAIILLNNPDTIILLIRELAGISQQN